MGWPIDTARGHFELVVASELPPPREATLAVGRAL